jgi:hypothetical protein
MLMCEKRLAGMFGRPFAVKTVWKGINSKLYLQLAMLWEMTDFICAVAEELFCRAERMRLTAGAGRTSPPAAWLCAMPG